MADWLAKITGRATSANAAKERLKFVLIHDRTDINPEVFEKLKEELLNTISRHVEIESSAVKITMMHEGREQRLIADIPLKPHERKKSN